MGKVGVVAMAVALDEESSPVWHASAVEKRLTESDACYNVNVNIAACFVATEQKEDAMGDYRPT
jgi:hypothetical protein